MFIMEMENKQLLDELKRIRIDIEFIKKSMPDKEMFLTADEEILLEESYINEKKGGLISSEKLRKEIGI